MPGDPLLAERPEQVGAVAGAGVKQAVGPPPQRRGQHQFAEAGAAAGELCAQRGSEDSAHGDKGQRMREVPVVLQGQERVAAAANQHVAVRQKAPGRTGERGGQEALGLGSGLGSGSAEGGLGEGVHVLFLMRPEEGSRRSEGSNTTARPDHVLPASGGPSRAIPQAAQAGRDRWGSPSTRCGWRSLGSSRQIPSRYRG